jgi:adenylate cyclase
MGEDETGTLERLKSLRKELVQPGITEGKGRIVKLMGDGLLAEFPSVVEAVQCAVDIQRSMIGREADLSDERRIKLRIGVNLGDVIVEGSDIYGDGVNVAARLEALAEPGGICVSGPVFDTVQGKLDVAFEDFGERQMKNIAKSVRVYRLTSTGPQESPSTHPAEPLPLPDKPSIAVLPFTNMSGDPEQEYFSDGISEDIITALSMIPKLFVVARNSTFTYKGHAVDVKQVGREQGVRYVLEGSVQRGGERLRITAQLIDATTGLHIWAQRYDRVVQDVFALQDEITREVTSALQVELTEGENARLWAGGTQSLEAWEAAIQAPELLHSHRRVDVLPARRLAERALELDPGYASAWAMLGWSYWNEAFNGWTDDPQGALESASKALERARAIDPSNPDTLALLGFLHLSLRKYDEARDFVEEAMALGPNNSFAPAVAANVALFCNQPQEMVPLLEKARRLCPIYPAWYLGDQGYAYLLLDRHQEAIETAKEATLIDPDYIYSYHVLAIAHAERGRLEEARAAVEHILRIEPKLTLRVYNESQPFRDEALNHRIIEGLRRAGLPE